VAWILMKNASFGGIDILPDLIIESFTSNESPPL